MTHQFVRTRKASYRNISRMEKLLKRRFEIPFGTRNTAKKIQAKRIVFRKSVASDVGFGEQAKTCDTASSRKLVPLGFTNGPQFHPADHPMKERFHGTKVAQRF